MQVRLELTQRELNLLRVFAARYQATAERKSAKAIQEKHDANMLVLQLDKADGPGQY